MVATAKPCDSEGTPASAQTTSSRCRPAGDFLSHTTACLGLQCLLQAPMASRGTHPVRRFLAHTTGWEALRSIACTAGSSASAQGAQLRLLQRLHLARCLGHLVVIPRVLTRCQQAVGPGWSWTMSLQPVRYVHTSGSNIRPPRPEGLMISNDDRGPKLRRSAFGTMPPWRPPWSGACGPREEMWKPSRKVTSQLPEGLSKTAQRNHPSTSWI